MTFTQFDDDEAARCRSPLYVFTSDTRHLRQQHWEHLMSLGLPYIKRIFGSTGDEKRDLFLHHVRRFAVGHFESEFLSDALRKHAISLGTEGSTAPAYDGVGYSESSPGWLWGHRSTSSLDPSNVCDGHFKGLRDWVYIFWDSDRFDICGMLSLDPYEVKKTYYSDDDGSNGPSVEECLHNHARWYRRD